VTFFSAFIASFVFVALKAFQQLNVVHDQYWFVVPTSMLMAACEVYVIATIVLTGWGWVVLWVGLGAGLGCLFSMLAHKRIRSNASR
jgi:predicted permease